MLNHYFKIIYRNIFRNKLYTIINLLGLSSGIAASLILLLYVQHELSFDQFHKNKDQIYRVFSTGKESGRVEAKAPFKLAPALISTFPEIDNICRVREMEYLVKKGDAFLKEDKFIQADSSFFDVFSFNILYGNAINALNDDYSVVITKSTADKYFPNENPLGKILEISYREKIYSQQITAVIDDFPTNSHIQADFILPIYTTIWSYENINRQRARPTFESWENNSFLTYIILKEGFSANQLKEKFPAFINNHINSTRQFSQGRSFPTIFDLQPLNRIHLFSEFLTSDVPNKGNRNHIYLFGGIAILILLIAIINYIILSTARSLNRTKEIGLRKVIGATRVKIMKQVLGESIFVSFLSLPIAIIFTSLFLPYINQLLGKSIEFNLLTNPQVAIGLIFICLFAGIISGSYIALYLSSFKPIDVFRSQVNLGLRGSLFQKSLIVIQLIIFIGLIICSGIIFKQVQFMKENKVLGFNKENLISVLADDQSFSIKYLSFKAELLTNPDILYVSSATSNPPAFNSRLSADVLSTFKNPKNGRTTDFWMTHGGKVPELKKNTKRMLIYESNVVDYDYIEALGLNIAEGRSFDPKNGTDKNAVMVNEEFIKKFNVQNPLSEGFKFSRNKINIIGIIKNYHSKSLTEKVLPLKIIMAHESTMSRYYLSQVIIRTNGRNTSQTLAYIENKWKEFCPNTPFEYSFTDTYIENMYKTEMNLAKLIGSFAVLAILIASLGLFGLSLFIAQKKTREIVIRKTMGASVMNIIFGLLKQFFGITIIANILAMPITYFYMDKWLNNFEYQSMMDYRIFVLAGISSLTLCLLTVSFHSAKAATIKPVEALKYE